MATASQNEIRKLMGDLLYIMRQIRAGDAFAEVSVKDAEAAYDSLRHGYIGMRNVARSVGITDSPNTPGAYVQEEPNDGPAYTVPTQPDHPATRTTRIRATKDQQATRGTKRGKQKNPRGGHKAR